ncbi:MFS transporter [Providencia rustigianii]|uniref:MFS transporter n=1 Tax=Providencia rustigianii TaxID=158850 RepID=UPI000F6D0517|nr:MFS transporter [Providencia rustigianii]VEH56623.1 Major Facilitator Superfamily [Providencia rustigianii]
MINKIMKTRFLSGISFYSFLPFFSLYLLHYKNINESHIAIIIFTFLFISRAFSLFTHFIISYLNYKITLFLSYLISCLSILSIYFISNFYFIFLSTAFIGAGFSIANVCCSLFIAESHNHSERVKNFPILNVIVNLSSALGGAIGEWFYNGFYSGVIFLPACIMFFAALYSLTIIDIKHVKPIPNQQNKITVSLFEWIVFLGYSAIPFFMLGLVFRNLAYLFELNYQGGSDYISVSYLFILNAFMIISLQIKITQLIDKQTKIAQSIIYKFSIILIAVLLLFLNFSALMQIYLLIILFTFSELIWSPYNNSLAIEKCPFNNQKLSLSICIFFWGLAESFGAYVGIIANQDQIHIFIPVTLLSLLILLFGIEYIISMRKQHENHHISGM